MVRVPALSDAELAELLSSLDDAQDGLMGRHLRDDRRAVALQAEPRSLVGRRVRRAHRRRASHGSWARSSRWSPGFSTAEWFSNTNGKLARIRQLVPNRPPQGQGGVKAPEELEPTQHWDRSRGDRRSSMGRTARCARSSRPWIAPSRIEPESHASVRLAQCPRLARSAGAAYGATHQADRRRCRPTLATRRSLPR